MSALKFIDIFYTLSPTSRLMLPFIRLGSTQDHISLAFLIRARMSPKLLRKISLVPNARITVVGYGALCKVLLSLPVISSSLAPDTPPQYTSPPPVNCTLPVLACPTMLSPMTPGTSTNTNGQKKNILDTRNDTFTLLILYFVLFGLSLVTYSDLLLHK